MFFYLFCCYKSVYKNYFIIIILIFFIIITLIFSCFGMFLDVPEYSGMFHVPGFVSGRPIFDMFGTTIETGRTSVRQYGAAGYSDNFAARIVAVSQLTFVFEERKPLQPELPWRR